MNRQYSFIEESRQNILTNNRTWTDQRVMQIMKKYEKPSKNNNYSQKMSTPNKETSPYHNSYLKEDFQERINTPLKEQINTPLREQNMNVQKYNYRREIPSQKKWKEEESYQRGSQNTYNPISKSIDLGLKETEKPYLDSFGRGKTTQDQYMNPPFQRWQYDRGTRDQRSYQRDYQRDPSSYNDRKDDKSEYLKRPLEKQTTPYRCYSKEPYDDSFIRKSIVVNEKNVDYTPVKKYSNRVRTEYYDHPSKEKDFRKDSQISAQKNKFQSIDCDARISNIDKINDKIKKILERCTGNPDIQKDSSITYPQKKYSFTPNKYEAEKNKNKLKLDLKPLNVNAIDDEFKSKKQIDLLSKKEDNQRSRSCLNEKKNRTPVRENNDDKYARIQQKIDIFNNRVSSLAEEKKKLNIDFKLNRPESTQIRKEEKNSSQISKPAQKCQVLAETQEHVKSKAKLPDIEIVQSHRSDHLCSQDTINERNLPSSYRDKEKCQNNGQKGYRPEYFQNSDIQFLDETYKKKDYQICQQEQPSYSYESCQKIETKKLIELLSTQAKLDEEFRLTKNWFVNSEISGQYEVLQSVLEQRWRPMTIEEIKADFSVNFEEDDPFYSYRPDQFVLEDLVNNYIICNKNWKQKIEHQWSSTALKQQGLLERLDMQGKGSVAVQDLVRIINMQEETFFRNRDLYLIYQRMLKKSQSEQFLTLEAFISILCRK